MAQKAITPGGGEADRVFARLPRGAGTRIEGLARSEGLTRSEYLRALVLAHLEEVGAEAS